MIDKLFKPFSKVKFIKKEFDFNLSPDHFIKWLEVEDEYFEKGKYKDTVSGMCEYSCLYVSMLLYDKKLKGDMYVQEGDFGAYNHFWIEYVVDNKTYIIDLTLQQFLPDSPKLAISLKQYDEMGYNFSENNEYRITIKEYIEKKKAFKFYTNPKTLVKPKVKLFFKQTQLLKLHE